MGYKVTQRILECDCCGRTPDDGENLWEMCGEYICEACFDDGSYERMGEEEEES